MKKILLFIIVLVGTLFLSGCQNVLVNEVYYESYIIDIDYEGNFDQVANLAIKKAKQSVIGVSNYKQTLVGTQLQGTGSGFVYKSIAIMNNGEQKDYKEVLDSKDIKNYKYYVITNRHVVEGDKYTPVLKVFLGDSIGEVNAKLVQYDDQVDIAVITFEHKRLFVPVEFGDSDALLEGDSAFAIGSPSGYTFFNSVTSGIISNPKRFLESDENSDGTVDWYDEYIQHDVAINPGNSGGPLINLRGQVIGMNTMKLVETDIDNMGFSIPSNLILRIVSILETGKKPQRATLGFQVYNLVLVSQEEREKLEIDTDLETGFYIKQVEENSISKRAGLQVDDIIVKINGHEVFTFGELKGEINKILVGSGQIIEFTVLRGSEEILIKITM